ncbi:MAG: hypothetical protein HKN33_05360 [Pyrinomonadaceae bacterium]|nr:hypothetical protein [Pyrinomonadaceae bacterium]
MDREFEKSIAELREARNKLLSFHKILIDRERKDLERASGGITAGQFLNLLMTDERFEWLRTISKLVVRIDEAFELDDGMPEELVIKFRREIVAMFDETENNIEFKGFVSERMQGLPDADALRQEIRALIN